MIVNEAALEDYKYYYAYDLQIDAEQPGFISKCIADRRYVHLRPRRKPMGGVREGLKKYVCTILVTTTSDSCTEDGLLTRSGKNA